MKDPLHHDPIDVLGDAYEKMYERTVEHIDSVEEKGGLQLRHLIAKARDKAVEFDELSSEDADKVANWLERDISDFTSYLRETGRELKDWLGFETVLIESGFLDLLLKAADETTVELIQLRESAHKAPYLTGEITGPGALVCDQCGEKLHFHKVSKIPPCPQCHATTFHRDV